MDNPKVSVVVPCYNVQSYIEETLDSLLDQTLEDIEIVCVNDGSTDDTLSILQRYAENDSRIKIIDKENGGYGKAMNVGMQASTGEYIGIVESDDYVKKNMFEWLYTTAKKSDLDFVKSDFIKFWTSDNGSKKTKYEKVAHKNSYYNVLIDPTENVDLFNCQMLNWTGIYKREFLEQNNIRHNESPGASYQDNGFWFQVFCCAHRGMIIDEAFYYYRQDNAASSINQNNKVFCMLNEYAWIREYLRRNPKIEDRFIGVYHYKKMHNLDFAFSLLAPEFQMPFLERYSKEYNEARENDELDSSLFYPDEWDRICFIMDDPEGFRNEYNSKLCDAVSQQAYEEARSKGKVALAMYIAKNDGFGALVKKTTNAIRRRMMTR